MPAYYIKVVFDLNWPNFVQTSCDFSIEMAENILGGALYRVKGLLEQTLLEKIEVFDIVVGCIAVRYRPLEPVAKCPSGKFKLDYKAFLSSVGSMPA